MSLTKKRRRDTLDAADPPKRLQADQGTGLLRENDPNEDALMDVDEPTPEPTPIICYGAV